jgi:hypothetical protein
MSQIDAAVKIVADLSAKRDQLETKKLALEGQRDACAFDAVTGSKTAKAKLAEAIEGLLKIDAEIASYTAAIRTGEEKVREAQGIARAEIARAKG